MQENVPLEIIAGTLLHETPATPERESETEPLTVTKGVLTEDPFEGLLMTREGGVRSRLTVALVVEVLAEVSVTVPETTWLAPSKLTLTGAEQL